MSQMPTPTPVTADGAPLLDAERLECYQLALEFQRLLPGLLPRGYGDLRSQLDRAAASILLNTAEGAGRRAPADKAHFYTMARGSAMESAAVLDLLRVRRLAPESTCRQGRGMLVRIVAMLTKLEAAVLARRSGP